MLRTRLLFEKTGRAQYISHLDLLRTFQRVFLRAGTALRHTEGFNPHPYMSFALPLPVGVESVCELLDFDLEPGTMPESLPERLNATMPEGLRVLSAYHPEMKFADLAYVRLEGRFEYDAGIPEGVVRAFDDLFKRTELIISKKSKKGPVDFDLSPCVKNIGFAIKNKNEIAVDAVVSAQNPSVSPENLATAVRTHLSHYTPDFAAFKRIEIYGKDNTVFR
jgi:radical SAM-linked protein